MAVNDIYRATFMGLLHNQLIESVVHFRETVTGAGNPQQILGDILDSLYSGGLLPVLSEDYGYTRTMVQKFYPGPPLFPTTSQGNAGIGAVTSASLPSSSAMVIKKQTVFAGRKYRGRIFQAGIPAASAVNSTIGTTPATAIVTGWVGVLSSITTSGWTWKPILWHHASNTYTDINNLDTDRIIRVRRRREVGVGL